MITIDDVKKNYQEESQVKRYSDAIRTIGLWKSELLLFTQYFDKQHKILDIGCGAGRTTIGLAKKGYSMIEGVDLSNNLIRAAKQIALEEGLNIRFTCGNAIDLPFNDNEFDGAFFSFNGLMQIPDKRNRLKVMREINRVIKPSTYFVFTTHSGREETGLFLEFWDDYEKKWNTGQQDKRVIDYGDRFFQVDGIEMFIHIPTKDEVKQIIKDSKFRVVQSKLRSEICEERKDILDYSVDCIFWIVQKYI
jgi:ubiquinone/menaquinone biosynthesis C-methylase UbiE